jgi:hypothetical protein
MNAASQRMVAELLARQLGVDAGELGTALGADPVSAYFALSMMGQASRTSDGDPAARLRRVAAIVGACRLCLGEDPACAECLGDGRPGWHPPNRAALLRWIDPPLRRAGLCVTTLRRDRPEPNPEAGDER